MKCELCLPQNATTHHPPLYLAEGFSVNKKRPFPFRNTDPFSLSVCALKGSGLIWACWNEQYEPSASVFALFLTFLTLSGFIYIPGDLLFGGCLLCFHGWFTIFARNCWKWTGPFRRGVDFCGKNVLYFVANELWILQYLCSVKGFWFGFNQC